MNESIKNESSIREYLLGRVSDETRLAEFEELLFLDEDFCTLAEIAEDALINDFVFGRLSEKDLDDFVKTLENNRQRREKIAVTNLIKEKANAPAVADLETKPSFFESLKAFFQKPLNAGAFAVVIIGIFAFAVFFLNRQNADEFADLKSVYQNERPFEPRIAGFEYAPLAVTRGAAEEREKNKLRRIENALLEAVEKNPSAETHHALGVFYLTQRKFDDAIKELEQAVKADEKNAQFNNDLGVAFLEFADGGDQNRKLENLARANEAFSKSLELNPEFPEARFNKSLTLQKLGLPAQAKESWEKYLEQDSTSKWADEARKNLEKIAVMQSVFKSKGKNFRGFSDRLSQQRRSVRAEDSQRNERLFEGRFDSASAVAAHSRSKAKSKRRRKQKRASKQWILSAVLNGKNTPIFLSPN